MGVNFVCLICWNSFYKCSACDVEIGELTFVFTFDKVGSCDGMWSMFARLNK